MPGTRESVGVSGVLCRLRILLDPSFCADTATMCPGLNPFVFIGHRLLLQILYAVHWCRSIHTEQATKTLCRNKETRNLVTTSTINVNRHSISFDWPMYKETFWCDRDLHFISAVLLYTTARNSDIRNANILPIPIKLRRFKRSFNETSQQADDIRRQKYHSNDRRVLHNTPRTEYNR